MIEVIKRVKFRIYQFEVLPNENFDDKVQELIYLLCRCSDTEPLQGDIHDIISGVSSWHLVLNEQDVKIEQGDFIVEIHNDLINQGLGDYIHIPKDSTHQLRFITNFLLSAEDNPI